MPRCAAQEAPRLNRRHRRSRRAEECRASGGSSWPRSAASRLTRRSRMQRRPRRQSRVSDEVRTSTRRRFVEIEKLRTEYQTADRSHIGRSSTSSYGQVAHAQSLVNAMVEAATTPIALRRTPTRRSPSCSLAVARYYTIGRRSGPGEAAPDTRTTCSIPSTAATSTSGAADHQAADRQRRRRQAAAGVGISRRVHDERLRSGEKVSAESATNRAARRARQTSAEERQPNARAGLMQMVAHQVEHVRRRARRIHRVFGPRNRPFARPKQRPTTCRASSSRPQGRNHASSCSRTKRRRPWPTFITLVKQGFYNGSPFHRVLPEFMAQGGDQDGRRAGRAGLHDSLRMLPARLPPPLSRHAEHGPRRPRHRQLAILSDVRADAASQRPAHSVRPRDRRHGSAGRPPAPLAAASAESSRRRTRFSRRK